MAYEPTNWQAGDVVTSAKLNKIEQGIAAGGGVLIAHDEDGTLDKTWQEIYDADACIICSLMGQSKAFDLVIMVSQRSQTFMIGTQSDRAYVTSSSDDYPIIDNPDKEYQ